MTNKHELYEIVLKRRKAKRGWQRLKNEFPAQIETCEEYLKTTPEKRIPGKVKMLRGRLLGLLQYDLTDSHRIRYWVSKNPNRVYILYAGPHP